MSEHMPTQKNFERATQAVHMQIVVCPRHDVRVFYQGSRDYAMKAVQLDSSATRSVADRDGVGRVRSPETVDSCDNFSENCAEVRLYFIYHLIFVASACERRVLPAQQGAIDFLLDVSKQFDDQACVE